MNESEFLSLYFEDTEECIADFEQALLLLEHGTEVKSAVDRAFRAMHTIKGNSGVFYFQDVVNFSHAFEEFLDKAREQDEPEFSSHQLSHLLGAVDLLRNRLEFLKTGQGIDLPLSVDFKWTAEPVKVPVKIQPPQTPAAAPWPAAMPTPSLEDDWHIEFIPKADLFQRGNDPIPLLRTLAELGKIETQCITENVPLLDSLNLDDCHLQWVLRLTGDVEESLVREAFEWVGDSSQLVLRPYKLQPEPSQLRIEPEPQPEQIVEQQLAPSPEIAAKALPKSPGSPKRNQGPTDANDLSGADYVRVRVDKIEYLINLVSELVVTQHALCRGQSRGLPDWTHDHLTHLERHTRNLQESVLQVRMVPIGFALQKAPRLIRDVCAETGKLATLQLYGENTDVDISILNRLTEPIMHILRNAICHGVEAPEQRLKLGKTESATIKLKAQPRSGSLFIEIEDDGAGINLEKVKQRASQMGMEVADLDENGLLGCLFEPGFSTAGELTHLAGRGVGLDVVRENLRAVGGSVKVRSELGKGTCFSLRVPLTLAILDGQICRHRGGNFAIPLLSILECITFDSRQMFGNQGQLYRYRDELIPVANLAELLCVSEMGGDENGQLLVIVETESGKMALRVDELADQQRVVLKSLDKNYQRVEGVLGATLLGDGKVTLVLDVSGLRRLWLQDSGKVAA
jgi:two-component system, chemotaxis family, sensor kinase CheA